MQRDAKHPSFDVMGLLSQHNTRWTLSNYKENQILYTQGDLADSVFTSTGARSRLPSFPRLASKPSLQSGTG